MLRKCSLASHVWPPPSLLRYKFQKPKSTFVCCRNDCTFSISHSLALDLPHKQAHICLTMGKSSQMLALHYARFIPKWKTHRSTFTWFILRFVSQRVHTKKTHSTFVVRSSLMQLFKLTYWTFAIWILHSHAMRHHPSSTHTHARAVSHLLELLGCILSTQITFRMAWI